jgi:hypothetical protein
MFRCRQIPGWFREGELDSLSEPKLQDSGSPARSRCHETPAINCHSTYLPYLSVIAASRSYDPYWRDKRSLRENQALSGKQGKYAEAGLLAGVFQPWKSRGTWLTISRDVWSLRKLP